MGRKPQFAEGSRQRLLPARTAEVARTAPRLLPRPQRGRPILARVSWLRSTMVSLPHDNLGGSSTNSCNPVTSAHILRPRLPLKLLNRSVNRRNFPLKAAYNQTYVYASSTRPRSGSPLGRRRATPRRHHHSRQRQGKAATGRSKGGGQWKAARFRGARHPGGTEIRVYSEEKLLASRFGKEFEAYRKAVPAYIPFVR